jgi:peptidyl-prolyl cis-trans isomerase C
MRHQVIAVSVAIAAIAACSKGAKGPVVASGSGFVVTTDEFKAKLDEQSPFVRSRYTTLERKKEFLENIVRFKVLAAEATRRKLDQDPEVQETLRKIMVQKLVRQEFDDNGGKGVPDPEVRSYYDAHLAEFQQPERVRASMIFLRADKGSPQRAAKADAAKKTFARLKAESAKGPLAFSSLARDVSEDPATKAAGGDLGFRTHEELEKQWSKEVADAAFALKDVGQESSVVEAPQGFFLLKLGARQPGTHRTFEELRPQLAARIARERRTADFDAFVKKLRDSADVKVNDAELDKLAVAAVPMPPSPGQPGAQPPAPASLSRPPPAHEHDVKR